MHRKIAAPLRGCGIADNLHRLPLLHTLSHGAQVGSCNTHRFEFARCGVENALFDEVYLPVAACGTQRVASGVTECSLLAGFLTDPCHKFRKVNDGLTGSQREFA